MPGFGPGWHIVVVITALLGGASGSTSRQYQPSRQHQARRVRWFTDADQVEANWAFARQKRGVATGFYPCCGVLGGTANGSLQLLASPAAARNLSQPYRALGYTVHPVIGLNDNASLEAAAAPGSTFAADAVAISARYNFSGVAFDYEAAGNYQTYARLLKAVSSAMHAASREVVVCVDTSNIFDHNEAFKAIEAAGVDVQLSMSTCAGIVASY